MNKKYEFVEGDEIEIGAVTLTRIRALRDIRERGVRAGDVGGYIETEENLPHDDTSWVSSGGRVIGKESRIIRSTVERSTVERSTVERSTVERSTVERSTVERSTIVNSTIECSRVINEKIIGGDLLKNSHHCLFMNVGSENGKLTSYRTKTGIGVTRGCFSGTLEEFADAVEETHGDSQHGQEYRILIEFIKKRAASWHGEVTQ